MSKIDPREKQMIDEFGEDWLHQILWETVPPTPDTVQEQIYNRMQELGIRLTIE